MPPHHKEQRRGRPLQRLGLLQHSACSSCECSVRSLAGAQDHCFAALDIVREGTLALSARRKYVLPEPGRNAGGVAESCEVGFGSSQ